MFAYVIGCQSRSHNIRCLLKTQLLEFAAKKFGTDTIRAAGNTVQDKASFVKFIKYLSSEEHHLSIW